MAEFQPRRIMGAWRSGYALDLHTLSSEYVGDDEFGRPRFETRRSELGELLYRLKYGKDQSVVAEIADAAARFLTQRKPPVDVLVPIPASNPRPVQPVRLLAAAISERIGIGGVSPNPRNFRRRSTFRFSMLGVPRLRGQKPSAGLIHSPNFPF
jgi:competence protein ComFC